jgi:hypothetical protein
MNDMLEKYKTKVECDDNSCSVRYYSKEGELSLGIIRARYHNTVGKIPQRVITIVSMEIDKLIQDVMVMDEFPIDVANVLVTTIRRNAIDNIKDHLGNQTPNQS